MISNTIINFISCLYSLGEGKEESTFIPISKIKIREYKQSYEMKIRYMYIQ